MDKENLKELVGLGELEQAFTAMLGYGKKQKAKAWYNALLIQHQQFKKLEQDNLQGVLSPEGADLTRNRIISALLSLIDDLPDGEADSNGNEVLAHEGGKTRWPRLLLIGAIVLLTLVAVYSTLNLFGPKKSPEPAAAETTLPEEKTTATQALHFPEGNQVTFIASTGDEISYRLLNGELKNLGGGTRQVSFTIRCSARKGYGANFWDDTFRLELDEPDVFLSPSSGLNELVDDNSSKDGMVSFVVKGTFSSMKLAIVNLRDKQDIRKLAIGLE